MSLFVCVLLNVQSEIFGSFGFVSIAIKGITMMTSARHRRSVIGERYLTCHTCCDLCYCRFIQMNYDKQWSRRTTDTLDNQWKMISAIREACEIFKKLVIAARLITSIYNVRCRNLKYFCHENWLFCPHPGNWNVQFLVNVYLYCYERDRECQNTSAST